MCGNDIRCCVGLTVPQVQDAIGDFSAIWIEAAVDRVTVKAPIDNSVWPSILHLFNHAGRFGVVVIVIPTSRMATATIQLIGLQRVVVG